MEAKECPRFEACSATICPLNSPEKYTWYPGDEICKNKGYSNLDWIKNQKKIAKRAKDKSKYFNFQMLNRNCRITKGITGLDPEKDGSSQLKKWLTLHPPLKKMSLAQKKALVERFRKYRQLKEK